MKYISDAPFLSAEVSDQNFADDEVEVDAESSKVYKKRRFPLLRPNDLENSQD